MKKNNLKGKFLFYFFLLINIQTILFAEIMHLTGCKNLTNSFIKNEYVLDFEKSIMTRKFIYDNKTYKKLKLTDLSIKKENSIEKFIYEDKDLILTDKVGYPQFYTQLVFEKNNPVINIKTVINNEVGLTKVSICNKVEVFDKES
ncbi:hypothetical protein N9I08_06195 [Candidatus Pelagibacter sp.]|jgi:hypothetical protein|nr:hypothetical protein [Candidatus Pelagibacter sp.]|tara:strand:+ start:242 stop:676 length:435 start_codon:yes stop_codon:yes gene_type:complete